MVRRYAPASVLCLAALLGGCTPRAAPPAAPPAAAPAPTAAATPAAPGNATPAPARPAGDVETEIRNARLQVEVTARSRAKEPQVRMQAAEFYMRLGDHRAAIPHLKAATALTPGNTLAWLALGDAATLTDDYPLAEKALARTAALDPDNPLLARSRGQLLLRKGRLNEAHRVLQAGLKRHPDDAEIRTALGNVLLILNRPAEAAAVVEPASRAQPERPDLHYLLADAYERERKLEAALREMGEVVRLDPQMHRAWGRMGLYLVNLSRYAEARPPLERALALQPGEAHYHWALGEAYLLDTSDPGNYGRAVERYRKALALDGRNPKALYSLAMALSRRGQPEELKEAVTLFRRLLQVTPRDMNAHYKLSETYRRLGQTREAEVHLAKFNDLFEKGRKQTRQRYHAASFRDTPEVHVQLARKHLQANNLPLAEKEFQLALARNPGLAEARRGLAEVRKRRGVSPGTAQ